MIYIPYTIEMVTELDETHPISQRILNEFGQKAPEMLSEIFQSLLKDEVLPKLNEGNSYARVLTLESALAEDLIASTENHLREVAESTNTD
jgi:hypothetical protein